MRKFIVAAVLFVVLVTGCGSNKPAASDASSTPATTAAPTAKPPAPATPTTLTREQAAQRYLTITKPANAILAEPKCKAAEDFLIDGGSWPPDGHPEYGEHADRVLRDCHKRIVPIYEATIRAFQTTAWPVDAREDMADLISLDQALVHCFKQTSKASSSSAMYKALECFPADDGSADRVRARFGLPGRDQG